ncbi:MAG: amidophosphoribosyltransferase [Candidatus Doudnabacteria bacterium CG10_big_fil_rev_8_21_14_0_10_41_10]|uniref:Amidophosphoribosyltransferase n=1 Tax=Candidatus Doudnabacteria bacterium CG10_big_fil_rev_8_21_14_0_10_41_10 TaxID=1974551 RepID=A0A2H0VED7_9BACT|nr:MAG: amidophosphoribosyltransferase [Candidatus Doudnabacteria bacterium CG10_big_fil_rev_8_21_14_0_10_41_10]
MCGITGIISNNEVAAEVNEALTALQHRGQDSAGMVTYSDKFHLRKGLGLAREVFRQQDMERLKGNVGIGQVRYPTAGVITLEEVQPFMVNSPYGIAMTFNGNLYNANKLREELFEKDFRQINSSSDGELLLNVFASAMSKADNGDLFDSICEAVKKTHERVRGGYSAVGIIAGKGMFAFRDPNGIRPLVFGKRDNILKPEFIVASENTMFEILGFNFACDVDPGEVVFIDMKGKVHHRIVEQKEFRPCIFEYVYFARVDAFLNGVSVYRARLRMGQNLGKKIKKVLPNLPIDVVIPAPQSATTAALSCAHELGVRYSEGIVKNHFIGRTFIMPGQKIRQKANKYKLTVISFEVKDKNVLIVDDSIVRGNVSRHIVNLVRKHGAKKVYFASASPPIRFPDLYGIDMPTKQELIAHNRTEEEIKKEIGADELIYQNLEDLIEAVTRKGHLNFKRPHAAYFDGDYPTEVTEEILREAEDSRTKDKSILEPAKSTLL